MAEEHQLVTRQKAFVLLQVFMGTDRRLKQSELPRKFTITVVKILGPTPKGSDKAVLDKAALEAVCDDLVRAGYLDRIKVVKTQYLQLTEKGVALLLSSPQYDSVEIKITGQGLTSLLTSLEELLLGQDKVAANGTNLVSAQAQIRGIYTATLRDLKSLFDAAQARLLKMLDGTLDHGAADLPSTSVALRPDTVQSGPPHAAPPTEAELNDEILTAFQYLLQEKYTQGKMVPIHAVRRRVAERLGEEVASHAVFDPAVQQLGRQHKVRLVSISDRRDVTDDEINASIPGANETFFFLKAAHEHVHA